MLQVTNLKGLVYILLIVVTVCACKANSKKAHTSPQNQETFFKDSSPKPEGYVNDYAGLYSKAEKDSLESILGNFEKNTSIQIALVVFKSSMISSDSLEILTQRLGNEWGVGQKGINNGVVIGICPECRKMTIQNGYGIEKIMSDAETKEIIDGYFTPKFKETKYFEGTITGLRALAETLTQKWNAQKTGN